MPAKAFKTEVVTDNFDSIILDSDKYSTQGANSAGGTASTLYLFFDNSVCVSAGGLSIKTDSENSTSICDVSVRNAKTALNS